MAIVLVVYILLYDVFVQSTCNIRTFSVSCNFGTKRGALQMKCKPLTISFIKSKQNRSHIFLLNKKKFFCFFYFVYYFFFSSTISKYLLFSFLFLSCLGASKLCDIHILCVCVYFCYVTYEFLNAQQTNQSHKSMADKFRAVHSLK